LLFAKRKNRLQRLQRGLCCTAKQQPEAGRTYRAAAGRLCGSRFGP
jgi:hypothetical protein